MKDEKYSYIFGMTAFALVLALCFMFIIAAIMGITGLAVPLACTLGAISFWGMLWSIPTMLALFMIGEMADERAATNHHRAEMAWSRNHRVITAFLTLNYSF